MRASWLSSPWDEEEMTLDDNQFALVCAIIGVLLIAAVRWYQHRAEQKEKERRSKSQGYLGPGD